MLNIKLIVKFSMILVILLHPYYSTSNELGLFKKAKKYSITIMLQNDYKNNVNELLILQNILNSFPNEKKLSIENVNFYRCDLNKFYPNYGNKIIGNDSIFNAKSIERTCNNTDIQKWFNCCMSEYPNRDFSNVFIYSSLSDQIIKEIKGTENSYKVYYNLNDLKSAIDREFKKIKNDQNILVLHYFNNKVTFNKCDTIQTYISENSYKLSPKIFYLHSDTTVLRPKGYGNENVYEIVWEYNKLFECYEIDLNGIKFMANLDSSNDFTKDNCHISGNKVIYRLPESELGKKCIEKYGKTDEENLEDCQYNCVYYRFWHIKIRGVVCDCQDNYGPYSQSYKISIQCAK